MLLFASSHSVVHIWHGCTVAGAPFARGCRQQGHLVVSCSVSVASRCLHAGQKRLPYMGRPSCCAAGSRPAGQFLEHVTRESSVIRASSLSTCGLSMPPTSPGAVFSWSSMVFASSRTAWRWGSGIWLRVREVVGVGQMVWSAMSAPSSAAAVFASAIVDEQSCAIFVICLLDGVCASFMSAATVSRSPFIAVSAAVASAIAVVVVRQRS
jgi:hypothetical protein